jgi:predicted transcriptional regulator
MKKIVRRDKLKIYGDLLMILNDQSKTEKIILTQVQVRMGVPFDRLKNYISELVELGLIEEETSLKLTEKGKQYLIEYAKVLDFMKRMGLAYQ